MLNIVENCISLHCCIIPIIIRFTLSIIMMGCTFVFRSADKSLKVIKQKSVKLHLI